VSCSGPSPRAPSGREPFLTAGAAPFVLNDRNRVEHPALPGQERALDQLKSPPLSGQSRCAVSLRRAYGTQKDCKERTKCHRIELSRAPDDFVI
jgi:hypothetical protein